jgi:hypothetical protein
MVESTCMLPLENAGIIVLVYVEGTLYQVEFILHKWWNIYNKMECMLQQALFFLKCPTLFFFFLFS